MGPAQFGWPQRVAENWFTKPRCWEHFVCFSKHRVHWIFFSLDPGNLLNLSFLGWGPQDNNKDKRWKIGSQKIYDCKRFWASGALSNRDCMPWSEIKLQNKHRIAKHLLRHNVALFPSLAADNHGAWIGHINCLAARNLVLNFPLFL